MLIEPLLNDAVILEEIGRRLARRRMNLGYTQADLAEQLEVSRQTVNAIETGRYDPSLPLAFRIAKVFSQPIEAIFTP